MPYSLTLNEREAKALGILLASVGDSTAEGLTRALQQAGAAEVIPNLQEFAHKLSAIGKTVYYFGCLDSPGHFVYAQGGMRLHRDDTQDIPWKPSELDCDLCPVDPNQTQGVYLTHRKKGWTSIAFWDRTGDSRGRSCSVFITEGCLTGEQVVAAAGLAFPQVIARLGKAGVALVERCI